VDWLDVVARYRKVMWWVTTVVTLIAAYGYSTTDAIVETIGGDTAILLIVAAIVCAPAVVATTASVYLWGSGAFEGNVWAGAFSTAGIFVVASVLSGFLGISLEVDPLLGIDAVENAHLPMNRQMIIPRLALLAFVPYLTAYGFGLFLTALVIGTALALEILVRTNG
jgi:hypothetical protein